MSRSSPSTTTSIEHPRVFQDRLPAKCCERGPKIVEISGESTDPLGNIHTGTQQVWEYDGNRYPYHRAQRRRRQAQGGVRHRARPLRRHAARLLRHRPPASTTWTRTASTPSCASRRFPGFAGSTFFDAATRTSRSRACRRGTTSPSTSGAAGAPGRQIPMAILPYWDVDLSTAEVERTAAKGAKAVSFTESPARHRASRRATQRPLGHRSRRRSGRRDAAVPALRQRRRARRSRPTPTSPSPSPCSGRTRSSRWSTCCSHRCSTSSRA